jgi:hypothetical protein
MSERAVPGSTLASRISIGRFAVAHPLTTVFALALAVRLLNVAFLRGNGSFFAESDTLTYWALGADLAKPETFWSTLLSLTDRMPLYPLVLASVQGTLGDVPRAVALIQAAIDAGTCVLIAALGALVSPLVGLLSGILAALSLTLVIFSTQLLTDTLFLFWFALMLLAGARFLQHPSMSLAFLAGVAGGLSLVTRPAVGLLLVAAIPLVFVASIVHRRGFVLALAAALLFAAAAAMPIAPVVARNVIYYGSFALTSQAGDHLAFWIVPLVTQRADGTPYQATVDRMEALYRQRLAQDGLGAEPNPFQLAAVKTELAREQMSGLPPAAYVKAWLEGMAINLGAPGLLDDPRVRALPKPSFYNTPGTSLWQKAETYLFHDPGRFQVLLVAGLVAMLPFLVLELIGFVILARILPWAALFAAGVVGYFLLVNGPVAAPKYRLPMEPVLIVLAAIPLARLVDKNSGHGLKRALASRSLG